jgi:hypothetical protein
MKCKNCGHSIYFVRFDNHWTHKRPVWATYLKPGDALLNRLDECRDCGCEKPEARDDKL